MYSIFIVNCNMKKLSNNSSTFQEEAGSLVDAGSGGNNLVAAAVDIAKMLKLHYCSTLAQCATLVGRCNKSLVKL